MTQPGKAQRKVKVSAYISSGDKVLFTDLSRRQGVSGSCLLSMMLRKVLDQCGGGQGQSSGKGAGVGKVPALPLPCSPSSSDSSELWPRKAAVLSIRLTKEELALLDAEAEKRTMSRSSFMSGLCKAYFKSRPHLGEEEVDGLYKANSQLAKIGGNLNQLVKLIRASPYDERREDLGELYRELKIEVEVHRQIVNQLIQANWRSWALDLKPFWK